MRSNKIGFESSMKPNEEPSTIHFGFQEVSAKEKTRKVAAIFDSIANRYDLINDVASFGMHRLWRRFTLRHSGVCAGQTVLDLAGGTGDFTARLSRVVGEEGLVVLADINEAMLMQGRARLARQGAVENVRYVQADAERLPLADDRFDCVTIGFGLRNMTEPEAALAAVYRVLKPGGLIVVLEFSQPTMWGLRQAYDIYSFHVLPFVGRMVAGDGHNCRYLAESIRVHPDQERLKEMMEHAGFERCEYFNLSFGIVAVHRAWKEA